MSFAATPKIRLEFLDAARAVAALMVLAEHVLDACLPDLLSSTLGYGNLGKAGVVLFLLISGFIIPASLEQGGGNSRFWLRRFFRLFPAYWLSIAAGLAYSRFAADLPMRGAGDWFLNLTMLQGFLGCPNVWGVFWTLQLELVIYAFCSLFYSTGLLKRAGSIAFLALLIYFLLGTSRPLFAGKPFGIIGNRFLYFAPLGGLVIQRYFAGRLNGWGLGAWVVGKALCLLTIWSVNHAYFPEQQPVANLWELAWTWGMPYFCFLALLAARDRKMPSAVCWLGRISYSVYLLHPVVLMVLIHAQWPGWAFIPAALLGTFVLSELAFRLVEMPGIALGRMVERRWWPARVEPHPVAAPVPMSSAA